MLSSQEIIGVPTQRYRLLGMCIRLQAPLGSFLHKPSGNLYKGKGSASTGALYKSLDRDEMSAEISAVNESNELDEGIDVQNVSALSVK